MGLTISSGVMTSSGGFSGWPQPRHTVRSLAQALDSGDLATAKSAYSALIANTPAGVPTDSLLAKIGVALDSGDLKGAREAMEQMRKSAQHRHTQGKPPPEGSSGAPLLATTGSIGTLVSQVA